MYVKGVGPKRAQLLKSELGIASVYDLLYHFPTGYVDRSRTYSIREFVGDMPYVQVRGRFLTFNVLGEGAKQRLAGLFTDGTGSIEVVWFRSINRLKSAYIPHKEYILYGKPTEFNGHWSMTHPEVDPAGAANIPKGLCPVYPLTQKLRQRNITSRTLKGITDTVFATLPPIEDIMPTQLLAKHCLMPLGEALRAIHNPTSPADLDRARLRLKYDELFYLQLNLRRLARNRSMALGGIRFPKVGTFFNRFYNELLPFPLTGAQKRVIKEIHADMQSGRQMNRLLQGDVGSGKTLVGAMCLLLALGNDCQGALMAPTEILAGQHYETLNGHLAPLGVNVKLLTGSTPQKERKIIHQQLLDGSLHIIVGTHALLEDPVQFKRLGLAVIDEQHRFGVAQRARLWTKNAELPPHVLVMTATPIPRTLAMTVYGDLDVSVIDELPPGRKPIKTVLRNEQERFTVLRGIGTQLREGRQVYIVYPLIEDNEKLALQSLEEGYKDICDAFPHYQVAYVHGRMKPKEKDFQMQRFASGEARILVATTVIEVGVNVPNATTMMIENAERFGLSQLHQLRGRVGRGADQSYCILMAPQKLSKTTRQRLVLMTQTCDGFKIAEEDMRMRGPGDIEGTQQSGLPIDLKIANLATDGRIIQAARDDAEKILDTDPDLSTPTGQKLLHNLQILSNRTPLDWSRIS